MAYLNIDRNECIGDSLGKLNYNATDFDTRLIALSNTDTNLTTTINNLSAQYVPAVAPFATCIFVEQQNSGEGGGSANNNWQTRTLNTKVIDTDGLGSLASNQFTLSAGTWLIQAYAPCSQVDQTQLCIVDTAGPTYYGISNNAYNTTSPTPTVVITAVTVATVPAASTKTFYIRHWTSHQQNGYGLGGGGGGANTPKIYTTVVCTKVRR